MASKKSDAALGGSLLNLLFEAVKPLKSVAVGFSGGVDSSVILAAASAVLGQDNVIAVTADSPTLPSLELKQAQALAKRIGVRHSVVKSKELQIEGFSSNSTDRCFYCKGELWRLARDIARRKGMISLADGVNADDLKDVRPGIRASDEAGVAHPLAEIGAGKSEVRQLARELDLPNWNKPAQACLSSRFPYGEKITTAGLKRVEAAEEFLRSLGFGQLRVRSHGDVARIEIPEKALENIFASGLRQEIFQRLKQLGFTYVTVDLEGFRSGSMNESLG